jgi:predicted MFS family arabinose efflux permease
MSKHSTEHVGAGGPSSALVMLLAVATGLFAANIYYAQPLIASIAPEIGLSDHLSGAVVSVTQIGFGIGLFLLVSLADLIENRRLVLIMLGVTTVGLIGAALSRSAAPFFIASFVVGVCTTGAQVLVPYVAHMAPDAKRGRIVGAVMSGLLTGVMLARPVALFIAASFGWRAVFWVSAVMMVAIGVALARMMPRYRPRGGMHYGVILASMAGLLRDMPVLRWRALYQALLFGAFNMFWTAVPLMLATRFGLDQRSIGLFALAGAGGALAAPFAGRMADRGHIRAMTAGAVIVTGVAFYATGWAADAMALVPLVILAVLIDGAVQANHIVSQKVIFEVPAETRGRVNALYMTSLFLGGASGSMLAPITYHSGGWAATALAGASVGAVTLILFAIELWGSARRRRARAGQEDGFAASNSATSIEKLPSESVSK